MFLVIGAITAAYAVVVLLLWLRQDDLVFVGAGRGDRPLDAPGVHKVEATGTKGVAFRAAEAVPAAPQALILHFVGNGEDLCSAGRMAALLSAYDVAVVSPEYPGYGASPGRPSVTSLLATADAAAEYAERRAQELGVPFVVSGSSLGTFLAVHVASAGRCTRLLLRAPPTTMAEAAGHRFWWLPIGLMLRHRFDSLSIAPNVHCPVLIVHGDRDDTVPLALGRRLCAAFAGPAELIVVPGAGHNDLSLDSRGPLGDRLRAFLLAR